MGKHFSLQKKIPQKKLNLINLINFFCHQRRILFDRYNNKKIKLNLEINEEI